MNAEILTMLFTEYQKLDAVNWSSLKWMDESPLSYKDHLSVPLEDTPAFQFGRIAHQYILEDSTGSLVKTSANRGTKAFNSVAEKLATTCEIRTLVTEDEHSALVAWYNAYTSNEYYELLQDNPQIEKVIVWTDPDTGIKCKCRPDIFTDLILLDLKTTKDTSERVYWNNFAYSNTEGQFAFYYDGLYELDGQLRKCIVGRLEKTRPYDTVWSALRTEVVWGGRRLYKKLLRDLAECLETDKWPGKSNNTIKEDGFPNWKLERNLAL